MTSIIALANQKGGVGKTTTAVNLAWYLAAEGWRTLLLDLDPQGNATSSLGLHKYPDQPTSLDWMLHHAALDDCLQSTGRERLSIMGANRDLAAAELDLKTLQRPQRRLAELLAPAQHRWDVVIIDCPPSLGLLTVNGLTAAQHVIIPVQCEYLALEGLAEVTGTIERIGRSLNPSLAVLGLVDEDLYGLDGLVVQHRLPFERRLRTFSSESATGPQVVCRRSLPDFDRRGSWYSLNGLPGRDPIRPAVRPGGVYQGMKE